MISTVDNNLLPYSGTCGADQDAMLVLHPRQGDERNVSSHECGQAYLLGAS